MIDAISRYAKKWDREEDNNFAVACYDMNSVAELRASGELDEADMANWGISDPEEWREAIAAALIDLLADKDGRVYSWDKRNGQVVYRIPGHKHGDGQVDSDEAPVWLIGSEDDIDDVTMLPEVTVDVA